MARTTVIFRFETADFDSWRQTFAKYAEQRGASSETIYRDIDEPTKVTLLLEWEDEAQARGYLLEAQMKARMAESGVVGVPQFHFVRKA